MLTWNFRKTVEIAERIISRLEREENWLLVVDNLDNLDALCKLDELNTKAILPKRLRSPSSIQTNRSNYFMSCRRSRPH